MTKNVALIAGASGHVGAQLKALLEADSDWRVLTLGRSVGAANHISLDLSCDNLPQALSGAPEITHLFYCVRAPHNESGREDVAGNLLMLHRLVEAVEMQSASLAHVHIIEGGKWYGAHLGPYKTPAHEDDPRHDGPNFYHAQEDWLRERKFGKSWAWSASRPSFVCAVTPGQGRNMVSTLGAYAAISRERSDTLDFPGSERSYKSLTEITDGGLLARALLFIATSPSTRNEAFNVTNGDWFSWQEIWPELARSFSMKVGVPKPIRLVEWSRDKQSIWNAIVERDELLPFPLDRVANWAFADFFLGQDYDVASDTRKLYARGFREKLDSRDSILSILNSYKRLRVLP